MSALKTHISISCDVYPELFAKLSSISNPNKRAELLKTLAEDGRRWRDGAYTQSTYSAAAMSVPPQKALSEGGAHTTTEEFKVPDLAISDAQEFDW